MPSTTQLDHCIVEGFHVRNNWVVVSLAMSWKHSLLIWVKLCSNMIEAGKAYIITNKQFVSGVRDLSQQFLVVCSHLHVFSPSLFLSQILFDQAQRSVRQQLHNFVKDDVRKFKETKKQFDKVREDMEIALVKNAQAPRHKPHEVEEATGTLTITRKCFRHLALDYVLQFGKAQKAAELVKRQP
uniref:Arf-GAP with coiled-coil, ANK repeat and PH domain-containing protein n=1 Tax=Anolis carolinensis TaxID=28377 RepID=H9GUW7_ANOCA